MERMIRTKAFGKKALRIGYQAQGHTSCTLYGDDWQPSQVRMWDLGSTGLATKHQQKCQYYDNKF